MLAVVPGEVDMGIWNEEAVPCFRRAIRNGRVKEILSGAGSLSAPSG